MKLLYTAKVDSKKSECLICGKHGIAGVIVTFKTWNEELFYCSPCISRLSEANPACSGASQSRLQRGKSTVPVEADRKGKR
jgi:hypothetical protein